MLLILAEQIVQVGAHAVQFAVFGQIDAEIAVHGAVYGNHMFGDPDRGAGVDVQAVRFAGSQLAVCICAESPEVGLAVNEVSVQAGDLVCDVAV